MIGRGAQGRPWILAEVASALYGTEAPKRPTGAEFISLVQEHYDSMIAFYGPELGNRVARKHLGWYMDEAGTPPGLRKAVLTERKPERVQSLLVDALSDQGVLVA